ncbi:hypothetical protein AVEN_24712-1 [Araneus ventricosus]|uniref:Uncharacterized protein n=1 Tax=Araneus ventricosus TaxID=182803 RepID=A0A4Y2K4F1_ARAVE|nr:hypothetical protein AVEN_24712-1 [Araneus ventricosus]
MTLVNFSISQIYKTYSKCFATRIWTIPNSLTPRETGRSKNFPLTTKKASLRQLASFEGRLGSEIEAVISATGWVWSGGVNDHPGWESPIHVTSSQNALVLKEMEERSRLEIKELIGQYLRPEHLNRQNYRIFMDFLIPELLNGQ